MSRRESERESSVRGWRPRASCSGAPRNRCCARRMVDASWVRSRGGIDRHRAHCEAREVARRCHVDRVAFYPHTLISGLCMKMGTGVRLLLVLALTAGLARAQPDAGRPAVPVNAIDGIIAAFAAHSIVAL